MSKRDPKLSTKYEHDDPDYESASSSSTSEHQSPRKTRQTSTSTQNIQKSLPPHKVEIISKDELVPPHRDETNLSHQIKNSQSQIQPHSSQFQPSPQTFTMSAAETEQMIHRVVQALLSAQNDTNKTSVPKIDLQKLTMKNYVDWANKMKYALKLNRLWVDPNQNPNQLQGEELIKNERAVLFMACYLDDQNSSFINDTNEKCFISAWNTIKKFHQPRSATVLTDIHRKIQALKHQAGQSIESHLMKLEAQFTRLHEIDKKLSEDHLVALILASVSDSSDFVNVFHSAMWEEESTLTIAKVKSVLISTHRRLKSEKDEEAHHSKFKQSSSKPSFHSNKKNHNRRPQDPVAGWKCPECEMDNHARENCYKQKRAMHQQQQSRRQGFTIESKRANQVEEENQSVNVAHAYAGTDVQQQLASSSHSVSIKSRLGEPVTKSSPYQNIFPMPSDSNQPHDDILDINFNPNYEFEELNYDDISSPGINSKTSQFNHSINNLLQNSRKSSRKDTSTEFLSKNQQKCMNDFNVFNFKKILMKKNFNLLNYDSIKSFKPMINANCNQTMNLNKKYLNSTTESVWIVDSGATLHMCSSPELLTDFTPHYGHNVIISDGSSIPIHGYGTLKILLKDDRNNSNHKLVLSNVAVVPKLSVNLISVRALASLGVTIQFTEYSCYIQHPKIKILFASVKNSSYIFRMLSNKKDHSFNSAMTCIHEWHRKLGHRNINHINKIKNTLNLKIEKCNCSTECISCLKGKFHGLPFPQESEKPMHPRDIITTDVCGPFRTTSIGGAKYFITFNCANTDFTEVAAIKSKSDCKVEMINYINKCKTQFGTFPKTIRSDRGGEYIDNDLQSFLKTNGISFQCTVPRCPQQNGISERKNRTLVEAIRTMLIEKKSSKLPMG